MQGNSGGGGAFAAAYILSQNPGLAAGLLGAFALAAVGYGAAVMIDTPHRVPLVNDIVAQSVEVCENAAQNEGLYTIKLKDGLTAVWSSQLEKYTPANQKAPLCSEPALNNFVLPYNYNQVGTNYRGEYRVMGVTYTHADGTTQAFVVKPEATERAPNAIDDKPDSPVSMGTVLEALNNVPDGTYQHTLPDGARVAVYMQQDGVTQLHGSSSTKDNDSKGWAGPEQMQEILSHYNFQWPVKAQPYSVNPVTVTSGSFTPS